MLGRVNIGVNTKVVTTLYEAMTPQLGPGYQSGYRNVDL